MNKFIMLVGLPGSGKSSYAQKYCEKHPGTVWLSSDNIRRELYGDEGIQGDNNQVFHLMFQRTKDALTEGKDVVYDACNITKKKRIHLLSLLPKAEKECVILATPLKSCYRQNSKRPRTVPKDVIRQMYKCWDTPYYFEGWDKITIKRHSKPVITPKEFVDTLMNYNQENPYHMETLGEHSCQTMDYLVKNFQVEPDSNLAIAGLLHDCGKPGTKTYKEEEIEKQIAHYYQHHCAGSYEALFFHYGDKSDDDILEISALIRNHMRPYVWESETTKRNIEKKDLKLWGEDFHGKICKIHEADEKSRIIQREPECEELNF